MLYKLSNQFNHIEPLPFKDIASFGRLEKDLENLIANNLLGVLFEDARLLPICQERRGKQEADIYALNEDGDLHIFELKRSTAGEDAVHQALRYAQTAGQWRYNQLQERFKRYREKSKRYPDQEIDLAEAHQEAFELDNPLGVEAFNRRQHLIVIGSGGDDKLIAAVDYWKQRGISIKFLPYRIYELAGEQYFDFFDVPYDSHKNPADEKGVLFDTNLSYDKEAIWYMMENDRVAAFGDRGPSVERLKVGDFVFFSHKGTGVVAAAKVRPGRVQIDRGAHYRDVEFITPIPQKGTELKAIPFKKISKVTGKKFFHARTIKVPYLSKSEACHLANVLRRHLEAPG